MSKTPSSDGGLKPSPPKAGATVSAGAVVLTGLMALARASIGLAAVNVPTWWTMRMRSLLPPGGGGTSQIRPAPLAS